MRSFIPSAEQIRNISAAKFKRRISDATFKSISRSAVSGVLPELGTEQIHIVLGTAHSIAIMCGSNTSVVNTSDIVLRSNRLFSTLSPVPTFNSIQEVQGKAYLLPFCMRQQRLRHFSTFILSRLRNS